MGSHGRWPLWSRTDEAQSLPAVTARDSSTPSNGPGSEILSDWRFVPTGDETLDTWPLCLVTLAHRSTHTEHFIANLAAGLLEELHCTRAPWLFDSDQRNGARTVTEIDIQCPQPSFIRSVLQHRRGQQGQKAASRHQVQPHVDRD